MPGDNHFTYVPHKLKSYDVWFLRYQVWQTEIFFILDNFLPIYALKTQKIKILRKPKKHLEILSLYNSVPKIMIICYTVPDMARDRCNCYFSFWAIFCPFTPLTAQKVKISKKWKKHLEISSFYTCAPKIIIRWTMVSEKWCTTDGQTEKETHRGGCPTSK